MTEAERPDLAGWAGEAEAAVVVAAELGQAVRERRLPLGFVRRVAGSDPAEVVPVAMAALLRVYRSARVEANHS